MSKIDATNLMIAIFKYYMPKEWEKANTRRGKTLGDPEITRRLAENLSSWIPWGIPILKGTYCLV